MGEVCLCICLLYLPFLLTCKGKKYNQIHKRESPGRQRRTETCLNYCTAELVSYHCKGMMQKTLSITPLPPRKNPQELAQNTSWPIVIPPFLVVRDIPSGQDLKIRNGASGAQACRHVDEVDQSEVVQPYVLCEAGQGVQWGRGTRRSLEGQSQVWRRANIFLT